MNPTSDAGSFHILLVDDDPGVRLIIQSWLASQGYAVHEAADSAEALRIWARYREAVDLLIADLVIPGVIDGKQLADRLRLEKPELQVILITGFVTPAVEKALDLDADVRLLPKPFDAETLLQAVCEARSRRKSAAPDGAAQRD